MKKVWIGLSIILTSVSLTALAVDAKHEMIEKQQQKTADDLDAANKAKPPVEKRPAATVKNSTAPPVSGGKADLIEHQQETARKTAKDLKAATPETESRPAVTTQHN